MSALLDDDEVIDLPAMLRLLAQASIALQAGKILRHLKLWPEHAESARLSRAPPSGNSERNVEPYFDDPFPDDDTEPVMAYDPACHGVVPRRKRSGRRRNFAT